MIQGIKEHLKIDLGKGHSACILFLVLYNMFLLPDSACKRAALAFASSRAVIQRWRSTSQLAFRWYVWAPPLEMTKLHASSTVIVAVAKFIVPRHVWPISAWVLSVIQGFNTKQNVTQLRKLFIN